MAIYHVHAKVHSRSTGASAVARAAYRARTSLVDERTGERHDHSRRRDLDHAEILAPEEAPGWARDRARLWNRVEAAERRKDAQVARELQVGLPVELSPEQRRRLVRDFIEAECVSRGMVADVAIHGGDTHNPHAHVLLTTRRIDPDGFGAKDRSWNDRKLLLRWREEWERHANRSLGLAGRPERIDHRSLAAQRDEALERGDIEAAKKLDRVPDIHHGKAAWMKARGRAAARADRGREIAGENARLERERSVLERRADGIGRQIRREQRLAGLPPRSEWKIERLTAERWRPGQNVANAVLKRVHERQVWREAQGILDGERDRAARCQREEWRELYRRQDRERLEGPAGAELEERHVRERSVLEREHGREARELEKAATRKYREAVESPIRGDDIDSRALVDELARMDEELPETDRAVFRQQVQLPAPGVTIAIERSRDRDFGPGL